VPRDPTLVLDDKRLESALVSALRQAHELRIGFLLDHAEASIRPFNRLHVTNLRT
jgi:hypothetical protein